jgi:hypothetical protein
MIVDGEDGNDDDGVDDGDDYIKTNKVQINKVLTEKYSTIFIEKITFIKNDDFLHKYKIWYEEQLYMKLTLSQKKFLVKQKINCPWIWIGENDNDMTQVLEEFLLDGNKIKLELLNKLFPDIKKWSYVCSKTLEIKEFPVEGIQIKHDTE